jgi:hypothetical protein
MSNTIYPAPLKNILKAGPALVTYCIFGVLFPTCLYNTIHHPHERVERYHFRSNKFERLVRKRDDKLRVYYQPAIEWSPNEQKILPYRNLNRYG